MRNKFDICFILNISLDTQGPSVHLLNDIIGAFAKVDHLVIQKNDFVQEVNFSKPNNVLIPNVKVSKKNLFGRFFEDYKYVNRVIKCIKEKKIDASVFFIQSSPTAYFLVRKLKKITKGRIVYNVQDIFPDNAILLRKFNKTKYAIFSFLNKKLYLMVDKIITISGDMKKTLMAKGVEDSKIEVIFNWGSTVSENQSEAIDRLLVNNGLINKKIILYAGNIGLFQNTSFILTLAERIHDPNIVFLSIGEGYKNKDLLKLALEKKLTNVVFLDKQPQRLIEELYKVVDVNLITLLPGVYKTALPSKLAFCLNTKRPLLITIEDNSELCELLKQDNKTKCYNHQAIDGIVSMLQLMIIDKKDNDYFHREIIYNSLFDKNTNVHRYWKTLNQYIEK